MSSKSLNGKKGGMGKKGIDSKMNLIKNSTISHGNYEITIDNVTKENVDHYTGSESLTCTYILTVCF